MWRNFVTNNRDRVFTVKYIPKYESHAIVTFQESSMFYFFVGDLILVEKDGVMRQ